MNDPLFEDTGDIHDTTSAQPNGDATPTPPPAPPAENPEVVALRSQVSSLGQQVSQLVGGLQQLLNTPAPEPPRPPKAAPAPSDALNELAADPYKFVKTATQEEIESALSSRVNPAIMQSFETTSQILVANRAAQIDSEFGPGAYDEGFKAGMDSDLAQLRQSNPRAMADPQVINALIDRQFARNFARLSERKAELVNTRAAEEKAGLEKIVSMIPGGGVPRLRQGAADDPESLPEGVKQDIAEMERSSGRTVDRKLFTKLFHAGKDSGPGRHATSLNDYLNAVGADAKTKKSYGIG